MEARLVKRSSFKKDLPLPLIFLLLTILPTLSHAQNPVDASTTVPSNPPSSTTMSTILSSTTTRIQQSMETSFISSTISNTTTSSSSSRTTEISNPGLFPPAGPFSDQAHSTDPDVQRKESAFNYYFLILAVFGVMIAIGLWWMRKRRKIRKEQMRLSGQNALARDLDGWVNTRRWMHGARRYNQTAAFVRREEGLNEHGEAPPPYQPKNDVTGSHDNTGQAQDAASGLTIPLRTLSRDGIETIRPPPEYQEADKRQASLTLRPETATTRATRPATADTSSNSSTQEFLRNESSRPTD